MALQEYFISSTELATEQWRQVQHPRLKYVDYECSNYGRFRLTSTSRLISRYLALDNSGYPFIQFKIAPGEYLTFRTASLIARTWYDKIEIHNPERDVDLTIAKRYPVSYPPYDEEGQRLQVDHIAEFNKIDDRVSNLQFMTQKMNIMKRNNIKKPKHGLTPRLSVEAYDEIFRLSALGYSQRQIAKHIGCNNSTCSKILHGKCRIDDYSPRGQTFPDISITCGPPRLAPAKSDFDLLADAKQKRFRLKQVLYLLSQDPSITKRKISELLGWSLAEVHRNIKTLGYFGLIENLRDASARNTWIILGSVEQLERWEEFLAPRQVESFPEMAVTVPVKRISAPQVAVEQSEVNNG